MGLGALEGQELPVKGGNQDEGQLPLNCRGGPGTSRGVGRGESSVLRFVTIAILKHSWNGKSDLVADLRES